MQKKRQLMMVLLLGLVASIAQGQNDYHKFHKNYDCKKVGIQKNKHHKFNKHEQEVYDHQKHAPSASRIREMVAEREHDKFVKDSIQAVRDSIQFVQNVQAETSATDTALLYPEPVYFVYDEDVMAFDDHGQIDLAIEHMKIGRKIVLEGHTDGNGTAVYNQTLSLDRAEKIKSIMLERNKKLNPEDIKIIGYGKTKPVIENDSGEHRQLNRRVEFMVINE